jgi:hypothetical protein
MRERDVAETDRFDQTVVTGRDHGVELIVEESIRSGVSHEAKVDNWKRLDTESSEVLFDGLSKLPGFVVGEDATLPVPPRTDLAHQDQLRGVGMERLPNELIDHVRAVVLGGVDVVHSLVNRLAQHNERLTAILGWPEHVLPRKAHSPEADRRHHARPQRTPVHKSLHMSVSAQAVRRWRVAEW